MPISIFRKEPSVFTFDIPSYQGMMFEFSIVSLSIQLLERLSLDRLWLHLEATGLYDFAGKKCYNSANDHPTLGIEYQNRTYGLLGGLRVTAVMQECLTGTGEVEARFRGFLNVSRDQRILSLWVFIFIRDVEWTESVGITMVKKRLLIAGGDLFFLNRVKDSLIWFIGMVVSLFLFRKLRRRRLKFKVSDDWFKVER
ncbi:MAG: hypothetical protein D6732_18045 [Methanobacteriota archaeon]|nr:MAG: hypothetical protein D6732_18045 [Euryarchaeota archaeon]